MLQWSDEALILAVSKFGDADAIVQLFTPSQGMARGVVKRGLSGKNKADLQPGNLVQVNWKARLAEHLGTVTLEAKHAFAARVMNHAVPLAAVGSAMSLLATSLAEHDPHPELYHQAKNFLQHVAAGVEPMVWMSEYVRLELALLEQSGFGLDLSVCADTGQTDELVYVSPRSGRAVCRASGEPYKDRLLPLPGFVLEWDEPADTLVEIVAGLELSGHFIETRLLAALHRKNPPLRAHFLGVLARQAAAA